MSVTINRTKSALSNQNKPCLSLIESAQEACTSFRDLLLPVDKMKLGTCVKMQLLYFSIFIMLWENHPRVQYLLNSAGFC